MPQEIGLSDNLTIKETLYLFGRLNGMTLPNIRTQKDYLSKILEIKLENQFLSDLSGGEQRRVSLAVALLHSPQLLILDEPTVGVDPLLRTKIWSHLRTLTEKTNTTIIITTHYIDEAKSANVIGAMREGRVLIEDSPMSIMETFAEQSLENCFLKLCKVDSSKEQVTEEAISHNRKASADTQTEALNASNFCQNFQLPFLMKMPNVFQRVLILSSRNILQWKRQLVLVAFTTFLPLIVVSLFCLILGNGFSAIPIGIANEEGSIGLAKKYVDHLDKTFIKDRYYDDFEAGINSVRSAENFGLVYLNKNFTKCQNRRVELGLDSDNKTIQCSSVSVHFDTTNPHIFLNTFQSLLKSYNSFYREHLRHIGKNPEIARHPLEVISTVYGTIDAKADEYVVPGIFLQGAFFLSATISCVKMVTERQSGMEERLWISRVSRLDLILSHFVTDIGIVLLQLGFSLISAFGYFKLPFLGSLYTLCLLALLQGISGLIFGFLISIMVNDVASALMGLNFALSSNLLMAGFIWPLNGMSFILRSISKCLPLTLPTEAVKNIMGKGFSFSHWTVYTGFLVTIAWGTVFVIISLLKLRMSR